MLISYNPDEKTFDISKCISEKICRKKGNSLLSFPKEYVVIDIETTGLSPKWDDIIELSAIKISNTEVVGEYSTLVKPEGSFLDDDGNELYVNEFTTELTGITHEMLITAPTIEEVLSPFMDFVGDSVVVGHNVNFDINFIYDNLKRLNDKEFRNNYCDLLRICRRLFPDYSNHKLSTIADNFSIIQERSHRGLADCYTAFKCFEYCRKYCEKNDIDLSPFEKNLDLTKTKAQGDDFKKDSPLYNKVCVFTGKLELMTRADAAQLVLNIGGKCENNVTQKTNCLILGNNDYCSSIKYGKSSKQKKAESLILKGFDIQIMPEDVFYNIIFE